VALVAATPVLTLENLEMKKTLVALAALASVSAFAQSSVTITGTVDVGYDSYKYTNDTGSAFGTNAGTVKEIKSTTYGANKSSTPGALTSNRLQIAGTEDLGAGRTAGFTYELGLNYANGASGLGGTARQSFISLGDAKLGTVSLGRQYSPIFSAGAALDAGAANNLSGGRTVYGKHTLVYANPGADLTTDKTPDTFTRVDSSVLYTSPNISGFTAKLLTAKNNNSKGGTEDTATTGAAASRNDTGLSLAYANGPFGAQVATHKYKDASASATANTTNATLIGASYDLGVAKLMVSNLSNKQEQAGAQVSKYKGTQFGVTAPFGAISAFATYGTGKSDTTAGTRAYDVKGTQAGVSYALSKRTNAYAAIGNETLEQVSSGKQVKISETAIGLRHSF
jgi:predicted porin